jgi:DNA-binding response OmpR family regulator
MMLQPSIRVLLVDDDPVLTRTYALGLELEGFDVSTVDNGEAALDIVSAAPFDVVLLDLSLPGIDGFEVLEAMRERNRQPSPIVVMFSNFSDLGLIDHALRLGAAGWIYKLAVSPPTLAEKIREVVPARHPAPRR